MGEEYQTASGVVSSHFCPSYMCMCHMYTELQCKMCFFVVVEFTSKKLWKPLLYSISFSVNSLGLSFLKFSSMNTLQGQGPPLLFHLTWKANLADKHGFCLSPRYSEPNLGLGCRRLPKKMCLLCYLMSTGTKRFQLYDSTILPLLLQKKASHQDISLFFDNMTPQIFSVFWTLSSYLTPMPVSPDIFKYPNVRQFMRMVDFCCFCLTPFPVNSPPTFYYQHSTMAVRPMGKCVTQTKPVRNLLDFSLMKQIVFSFSGLMDGYLKCC